MGYPRSRHTSTEEITPSCHMNLRSSSKRRRRNGDNKENASGVGVKCSSSVSGKGLSERKRTCLQVRDENSTAESFSEIPADGETGLGANQKQGEGLQQLNSRDEGSAHALNVENDGKIAVFSDARPSSTECLVEDQSVLFATLKELYSKLHLKYKRLKERKLSEVEEYIEEQNRNLIAYAEAQHELLEQTRRANDWLKLNADEEKITVFFNRLRLLEMEKIEWQTNLHVQHTENLELKNEVKRLKSLLSDCVEESKKIKNFNVPCQRCKADCSIAKGQFSFSQDMHSENACSAGLESNLVVHNSTMQTEGFQYSCQACGHNNRVDFGEKKSKLVGNGTNQSVDDIVQVGLVRGIIYSDNQLGKDAQKGEATDMIVGKVNSFVRALLQGMAGFKISIADEAEAPKLFFLHQSSGFSFHLRRHHYEDNPGENGELMYQVVSLGTLHKIVPDWMKEEIIFTIAQVDVFFNRLLQVTNGHDFRVL
ncbi:hypothetical protein SUGI_0601270 [Cryptomeria japonica]|uniref:uncharacterized protein LOC131033295 n=1 Tax=Cryptomeria japonica TaxID=3369 RepID=UPI00241482A1|nr:uncharacterized protein LOC131033295 [Cryptomeria japonica]GLJ30390.1 hypothetical protein SUGI_0601270 [Cryptomeria japonica]